MAFLPIQNSPTGEKPRRSTGRRRTRRRALRKAAEAQLNSSSSEDTSSLHSTSGKMQSHRPMWTLNKSLFVAMDCEMVGVGPGGKQSALARVTLVDWHGQVLMDEFVQQHYPVTDYRTFVSGITPEMLWTARMDWATCREQVKRLLFGKVLVGHGLKNDLGVLQISHPWHMIRDTAKYEPFMKVRFQDGVLWPRRLQELCQEQLGRNVHTPGCPHCPYQDALAAMELYRRVRDKWEKSMEYKVHKTRTIEHEQCLRSGWKQEASMTRQH